MQEYRDVILVTVENRNISLKAYICINTVYPFNKQYTKNKKAEIIQSKYI